jgi:hypothetical protein
LAFIGLALWRYGIACLGTSLLPLGWLFCHGYTSVTRQQPQFLFIAIIWKILRCKSGSIRTGGTILMIAFLAGSFAGLAANNLYAFGNAAGPFNAEIEISKTSIMVLFGLLVDQNQGFLLQNPVMLLGLLLRDRYLQPIGSCSRYGLLFLFH